VLKQNETRMIYGMVNMLDGGAIEDNMVGNLFGG
jgi:hypothetical protein